ncbi:MAG: adenylate/guanylate cyclase domain-containing protein, partial [Verrucomicrobiota bacterium]
MKPGFLIERESKDKIALQDTVLIGRKKDCHIRLKDSRVSRQHAMIRRQDDGDYWFYDLGSSNGSYINDQRVITTRKLANTDVIRICEHEYAFDAGDEPVDTGSDDNIDATISEIRTIPVIMLVSDIKGFTKISELLPPDSLAQTIGSWYRECDDLLGQCGATVDKFSGDSVLAYWMDTSPPSRNQALQAGTLLQKACRLIMDENPDLEKS